MAEMDDAANDKKNNVATFSVVRIYSLGPTLAEMKQISNGKTNANAISHQLSAISYQPSAISGIFIKHPRAK